MIAFGLVVEFLAAILLVIGLLLGTSATGVLWASTATVLAGLVVTMTGVRRARPPRSTWVAPPARRPIEGVG